MYREHSVERFPHKRESVMGDSTVYSMSQEQLLYVHTCIHHTTILSQS